jgi:hypothetical protein
MRRHYTNYFKGIPNFKPYQAAIGDFYEDSASISSTF